MVNLQVSCKHNLIALNVKEKRKKKLALLVSNHRFPVVCSIAFRNIAVLCYSEDQCKRTEIISFHKALRLVFFNNVINLRSSMLLFW